MAEANNDFEEEIQEIRGWLFPKDEMFPKKNIEDAMDYMPEDGDFIIASYPKTGTTWMQYIVVQIISNGESFPTFEDIMDKKVPFLETTGTGILDTLTRPRTYKHHLPYSMVKKNKNAKYIYTYRNPEDTLVSFFHFLNGMRPEPMHINSFFKHFLSGRIGYGRYFEHVRTYYDHKDDQNLLLVSYEKLLRNRKEEILRIAKFLGEEYYENLLKNESVLESILEKTSFDYMKKNLFMTHPDLLKEGKKAEKESDKFNFFRKGTAGDGKQSLSTDQLREIRETAAEVLKETEILQEWLKN